MSIFGNNEVKRLKQEIQGFISDFRISPRSIMDLKYAMERSAEKILEAEALHAKGKLSRDEVEEVRREAQKITQKN